MAYCQDNSPATVKFKTVGNQDEQFTTKNVPIFVECDPSTQGKYIYTVRTSGYLSSGCIPTGQMNFSKVILADNYEIRNDAIPVAGYEQCTFYNIVFLINNQLVDEFRTTTQYTVEFVPNPNYKQFPLLTIKNQLGATLFTREIKDCNSITISCGEECPPNHIKCKCDSYPGYCCIPCNEIKGGIAAATAAARGINRG